MRLVRAALCVICIHEVPVRISVVTSAILTAVFRGFPHYFQVNAGTVPQVRPRFLRSTFFLINFSTIIEFI
jgi:hypothetical protein